MAIDTSRDAQGRTQAERAVDLGTVYPYDGERPERDWAHKAARGILYDLCDRRGIKHELALIDGEVRVDIVDALAEIVREAAGRKSDDEEYPKLSPFDGDSERVLLVHGPRHGEMEWVPVGCQRIVLTSPKHPAAKFAYTRVKEGPSSEMVSTLFWFAGEEP